MTRTTNPRVRTLVLAGMLALSTACVFQELGDLPAFQLVDQGSDMPGTNNGQDMAEDTDPDLLDMAPDLPEDMAPDLPADMEPDADMPAMPTIPSGTVCFTQNPPTPICNPVEQTGCATGECKIVFVDSVLDTRCAMTTSGDLEEGATCNPASLNPECGPELACVVNVCRQLCRIYDAYGCDPDGPNPACKNEYSQTGFGTCWPTCQP